MVKIDQFQKAFIELANKRIENVLFNMDYGDNNTSLTQIVSDVLQQYIFEVAVERESRLIEDLVDAIYEYQHTLLQQVYKTAFIDGVKLDTQLKRG